MPYPPLDNPGLEAVQATPSGVIVNINGQPTLMPESAAAEQGLINPSPGFNISPLQAPQPTMPAPAAPPPQVPPTSTSNSQRVGYDYSTTRYTDQTPAPPQANLSAEEEAIAGAEKTRQEYLNKQADSYDKQGQVAVDKENALQPLRQKVEADVAEQQKATQAFDQVVNEHVEQESARLMQMVAAVPQIDPGKIWSDQPAWQNALGLLSAVTGGMLAVTMGTGKNMGLEAIERAIDRDVQVQQANIDNQWKRIANDKDSLQQYQQWKARTRENVLADGILRREALAHAIESQAAKYDSQSKQAELQGLASGIRAVGAEKLSEYYKAVYDRANAKSAEAFNRWEAQKRLSLETKKVGIDAFNAQTNRMSEDRQRAGKPAEPLKVVHTFLNSQGQQETWVADPAFDLTDAAREKLSNDAADTRNMVLDLEEYRNFIDSLGRKYAGKGTGTRLTDGEVNQAEGMRMRLASKWAKAETGAQYADAYRLALMDAIGGPKGLTGVDQLKKMNDVVHNTIRRAEVELNGRGMRKLVTDPGQPATNFVEQDAGGERPPSQRLAPFVGRDFSMGAAPDGNTAPVREQMKNAIAALATDDPAQLITAMEGLQAYGSADLALVHSDLVNNLSMMQTKKRGGRTVYLMPGDRGYDETVRVPEANPENAITALQSLTRPLSSRLLRKGDRSLADAETDMQLFLKTGQLPRSNPLVTEQQTRPAERIHGSLDPDSRD